MDEKKARRKGSLFSFGKLFKLILFLLVAAIAVDIYKNKGYKGTLILLVCCLFILTSFPSNHGFP